MKFKFYNGTRDGSLVPTKTKGDKLSPLIDLYAVNATKRYMYDIYNIIESYIVCEIARISAHCRVVAIDNVKDMIADIVAYLSDENCYYNHCKILDGWDKTLGR